MLRKRWIVRCVSVHGEVMHRETFWTRQGALRWATDLRSALYDITIQREGTPSIETVYRHVPPHQFVQRITGRRP